MRRLFIAAEKRPSFMSSQEEMQQDAIDVEAAILETAGRFHAEQPSAEAVEGKEVIDQGES